MLVRACWGQDESLPELLKAIRGGGAGLWLQYLLQNIKPGLWHQPSSVPVLEGYTGFSNIGYRFMQSAQSVQPCEKRPRFYFPGKCRTWQPSPSTNG
jgi:hypothetical protein